MKSSTTQNTMKAIAKAYASDSEQYKSIAARVASRDRLAAAYLRDVAESFAHEAARLAALAI